MKVIASEAKQSRPLDTHRLPRRPDTSGLLAMTKDQFFREKTILLEAFRWFGGFGLGGYLDRPAGPFGQAEENKRD